MKLIRDTRAQAIGLSRFFLALIVGAIMLVVIFRTTNPMLSRASNTTNNAQANAATDWMQAGINHLPVVILLLAFFSVVVYAVYAREILGR